MYFLFIIFLFFSSLSAKQLDFQNSIDLIQGRWKEESIDLKTSGKAPLELKRVFYGGSRDKTFLKGWSFNLPDFGQQDIPRKKLLHPQNRRLDYTYDEEKRLSRVEVVFEGNVEGWFNISYAKDSCTVFSDTGDFIRYNFKGDSLISIETSDGQKDSYSYIPHPTERVLLLTESSKDALKLTYSNGKIKEVFQNNALLYSLQYDSNLTTVVNAQNAKYEYRFNSLSQIESITTYLPNKNTPYRIQEMQWEGPLLLRKTIIGQNKKILVQQRWAYDKKNNPVTEWFEGVLTGYTDKTESFRKNFAYDEENRLIKESSVDGFCIEYTYDGVSKNPSTEIIQGLGKTSHIYDSQNNLTYTLFDDGNTLNFEKKSEFKKTKGYLESEGEVIVEETVYTRDSKGRVIREENLDGSWISTTYSPSGVIASIETSSGERTIFSKNLTCIYKDSSEKILHYAENKDLLREETYKNGLLISSLDYIYDPFHRLIEKIENGNIVTKYSYDSLGRKISETLPEVLSADDTPVSWTNKYSYDELDRLSGNYNARGQSLDDKRYTLSGNLQQDGSSFFKYDSLGRIIKKSTLDDSGKEISFLKKEYSGSRLVKEIFSSGVTIDHTYKTAPEKLEEKPQGKEEIFLALTINELGQTVLEKTIYTIDGIYSKIRFDALKRPELIRVFLPDGNLLSEKTLRHDPEGRKIKESSNGIVNAWTYDKNGNLLKLIESGKKTVYTYTKNHKLHSIEYDDGIKIIYSYDAAERIISITSNDNTCNYELSYNKEGRLEQVFDHVHNLESIRKYSLEGQVIYEKLANGLVFKSVYDESGKRTSFTLPDESRIETLNGNLARYNEKGTLLYSKGSDDEMICALKAENYFEQSVFYDELGRIISLKTRDSKGSYENNYSYFANLSLKETGEQTHHYTFDSFENLIASDDASYTINTLNQIDSLEYDLRGNLIKKGSLTFSYDALNRLSKVWNNEELVHHYAYDIFHRRVQDFSTLFLYDGLEEIGTFVNGTIKELKIANAAIEIDKTPYATLYHVNGSVAVLVDIKENKAVESYRYTSFGKTEGGISPWLFAGKRQDPVTQFLCFARRDYDPDLGRFTTMDPLGFPDGMNRYAYCHNDPINLKDFYGLSVSDDWENFTGTIAQFYNDYINNFLSLFRNNSPLGFQNTFEQMAGNGFLLLSGFRSTEAASGVYGLGEVNNKVRVSFINGILTDKTNLFETLKALSESHGNVNIHYVYRPTKGWVYDLLHSFAVEMGMVSTQAKMLAGIWQEMIQEMGGLDGGGKIIHYAHSIGSIETMRALSLLSPEEQKLIFVYAFGAPNLTEENPNYQIRHFISVRDGVPFLNLVSYIKACTGDIPDVVFTGAFGVPFIDHLFRGQTYQDIWKSMGRTFIEWYGTL